MFKKLQFRIGFGKKYKVSPRDMMQRNLTKKTKSLVGITSENINDNIVKLEYAVRGPIPAKAVVMDRELKGGKKFPFPHVIRANIGDAQAMGQKPFTSVRQLIAAVSLLSVNNSQNITDNIPNDIVERAKRLLSSMDGYSCGAYTNSTGIAAICKRVQDFIHDRDLSCSEILKSKMKDINELDDNNIDMNDEEMVKACDYEGYGSEHVFLSTGASSAIRVVLSLLIDSKGDVPSGVLVPVPQYPLYSASITEYGMKTVPYYLDESSGWGLNIQNMEESLSKHSGSCKPRAVVVINPGNPTGQVLTLENLINIVKFAYKHNLIILSDEVYQYNVYDENLKFYSMKSVVKQLGYPITLASFQSISKGYFGECGLRGGYCELYNSTSFMWKMVQKLLSVNLCPSSLSQSVIELLVDPPKKGDESYFQFEKDKSRVLSELTIKAKMTTDILNSIEGIECNAVKGAMYAFPKIGIPQKAIEEAKKNDVEPDAFYCMQLLDKYGICVVPGSGFLQTPGTFHFRTTILPPRELLEEMLYKVKIFHKEFTDKYS